MKLVNILNWTHTVVKFAPRVYLAAKTVCVISQYKSELVKYLLFTKCLNLLMS